MKKIFALLLAIVMVMGLATVASAEDIDTTGWKSKENNVAELKLNKIYTVEGQVGGTGVIVPDETLKFTSTPATNNPTQDNLTIAELDDDAMTGTNATKSGTMTITLPVYSKTGVYNYTIKETEGAAQAATYSGAEIGLQVLVTYDYTAKGLATEISLTSATGTGDTNAENVGTAEQPIWKLDTFENTYKLGSLEVKKVVTGNLGAKDVEFKMTVKFSSEEDVMSDITITDGSNASAPYASDTTVGQDWTLNSETGKYEKTATIFVRDGETVTFDNIPQGVEYVVTEDAAHEADDPEGDTPNAGYDISYSNQEGTIAAAKSTATVTNDKDTDVATGIVMDSVPFVVMAVIAVLGLAAFTAKKRVQE